MSPLRIPTAWVYALVPLLVLLTFSPPALAQAYEGFAYPVGPGNNSLNGGTGFVPGGTWSGGTVVAGSLSDPSGTLATTGNRVQGGPAFIERRLQQVVGTPGTDVWLSWLQRRDAPGAGFQGLLLAEPTASGWTGTYFIGEPGGGPGDNTYVIGKGGDDFGVSSSGVPAVTGQTAFLVAHLQFRDGNDLATLYVNPAPGAAAPTGGVTYSGLDMPLVNPILSFQSLPLSGAFDELRMGSSYAAVAPLVPEPTAAALASFAAGAALLRRRRRR